MPAIRYIGTKPRGQKNVFHDGGWTSFYSGPNRPPVEVDEEFAVKLLAMTEGLDGEGPKLFAIEEPELALFIPCGMVNPPEEEPSSLECKICGETLENQGFLMAHHKAEHPKVTV